MSQTAALSAKIRLATASPATRSTRRETLAQLERLARSAAERKADFLLLPEAYLGGYPRGSDFGCKIGGRTEEGRDEFRRYFRDAVDLGDVVGPAGAGGLEKWVRRELPDDLGDGGEGQSRGEGPPKGRGDGTREEIERVARETGVFIVVGLVERAGGSLYCAVTYVCPRRGMIGKRRKVMPVSVLSLCVTAHLSIPVVSVDDRRSGRYILLRLGDCIWYRCRNGGWCDSNVRLLRLRLG